MILNIDKNSNSEFYNLFENEYNKILNDRDCINKKIDDIIIIPFIKKNEFKKTKQELDELKDKFIEWENTATYFLLNPKFNFKNGSRLDKSIASMHHLNLLSDSIQSLKSDIDITINRFQDKLNKYIEQRNFVIAITSFLITLIALSITLFSLIETNNSLNIVPNRFKFFFNQLVLNGLISGVIYALIAIGFTLIYRTQKIFHIAHGLVYTIGAYLAFTFSISLGFPSLPAFFLPHSLPALRV